MTKHWINNTAGVFHFILCTQGPLLLLLKASCRTTACSCVPNYFPTNLLKLVLNIRNRCPKHGLSQILAEFCKLLGIVVMSDSLSHCPCPFLGVVALEDSWTNKDTIHPKLHQQCHICRRGYKQYSRVRYSPGFKNQLKALSVGIKIIRSHSPTLKRHKYLYNERFLLQKCLHLWYSSWGIQL